MKKSKQVTRRCGFKKLACKYCSEICERVDEKADAITCSKCVIKLVNGEILETTAVYKKLKK
jgi:hypothetical protein